MAFTDEMENKIQATYFAILNKKHRTGIKGKTLNCDSFRKIVEEIKNEMNIGLAKGANVLEITNSIIFNVIKGKYFVYENHEMAALIGYIYLNKQGVKVNDYAISGINNNSTFSDIEKITSLW